MRLLHALFFFLYALAFAGIVFTFQLTSPQAVALGFAAALLVPTIE